MHFPYICMCKGGGVRLGKECDFTGQVSVVNEWKCACKPVCWIRVARLR